MTDEYDNQDVKDDNYTRGPIYTDKPAYRENSNYEDANNFHSKRKHSPIFTVCLTVIITVTVIVVALGFLSNHKDKSGEIENTSSSAADVFIAVKNKSTFLNLVLDYDVTNNRAYITFKIPTK